MSENIKTKAPKKEEPKKEKVAVIEKKIIWGSYLEKRTVEVKPIESSGKWKKLLVAGQDLTKEPFMFNKVKKSFQVPLVSARHGGGIKVILDDIEKKMIKKYVEKYPEGMTERQFFEEELGTDLSPYNAPEDNFWRTDKKSRVTLTKQGLTLNLNTALGMLRYKILLSNTNLIAPSYEDRKKRATYEFMVVNQGKLISKKAEAGKLKTKAFAEYGRIVSSDSNMKGFIRSLGRTIPTNYNSDWLETEILQVLEESPAGFLKIVQDPAYKGKIFMQQAVEAGAIKKMNDRRYTLDNGFEIGDLPQALRWMEDPENQDMYMRIKTQIELSVKK